MDSSTDYAIMRRGDVKLRDTESDQRLYYFDEQVDLTMVTSHKSHVEPAHLHSENFESYLVIQGKMILNIEGEAIWLYQGDMVRVNPGICHHFETTDEKVVFIAIKKISGLKDKESC